jgi:hypothetical protein
MAFTLAQQMVRAIDIFQALLSLPVMWRGGSLAMGALIYPSNENFAFVSVFLLASFFFPFNVNSNPLPSEWLCVGLFAAGIIFIVLVQRYSVMSRKTNLYFEIAKSSLATGVW